MPGVERIFPMARPGRSGVSTEPAPPATVDMRVIARVGHAGLPAAGELIVGTRRFLTRRARSDSG